MGQVDGAGYPYTGTEIALRPPNRKDPNGFFDALGLPPWASEREVRRVCRKLLAQMHPDGSRPNRRLYERVAEIQAILTKDRVAYEATPTGATYIDSEMKAKLSALSSEDLARVAVEVPEYQGWSYYTSLDGDDHELAAAWYDELLAACRRRGVITTLHLSMYDFPIMASMDDRGEVMVPRRRPTPDWADRIASAATTVGCLR